MNASVFLILLAMLPVGPTVKDGPEIEKARLEFMKAFPSYKNTRAQNKGEIGFGVCRVDIVAFNGDIARRGVYLYIAGVAEFFPNYYDRRMEYREAKGMLDEDFTEDIAKINRLGTHIPAIAHADIPARIDIIKMFLGAVGLGEIIDSKDSLGRWASLVRSDIAAGLKPLGYNIDSKGNFVAEFFTFSPGRELSLWSFKLDEKAQILAVKHKVLQEWSIVH